MMLKITVIAWIVFIILKIVFDILIKNMSTEEKLICKFKDELPTRLIVFGGVTALEFIVSVILTIITVIQW